MKKLVLLTVFILMAFTVWGEELWIRYYSAMTEQECQEIIGRTISACVLQHENTEIYGKLYDIKTNKPYLKLEINDYGDYWFTIAGPYYSSKLFIGRRGYIPTEEGYVTYMELLKLYANPRYVALSMEGYFKNN